MRLSICAQCCDDRIVGIRNGRTSPFAKAIIQDDRIDSIHTQLDVGGMLMSTHKLEFNSAILLLIHEPLLRLIGWRPVINAATSELQNICIRGRA